MCSWKPANIENEGSDDFMVNSTKMEEMISILYKLFQSAFQNITFMKVSLPRYKNKHITKKKENCRSISENARRHKNSQLL